MKRYTIRRFSQTKYSPKKILNTRNSALGFDPSRNYDADLTRLGKINTAQGELRRTSQLRDEMRELNRGLQGISEK